MDSENRMIVSIVAVICITIIIFFTVGALWNIKVIDTYTGRGYTRTTLPGSEFTHWVATNDINNIQP